MKVNINGRGIIPGIGTIPPVYNREMSENEILRLLNFQQFKVYSSASGVLITKGNIKEMINDNTVTSPKKKTETVDDTPTPTSVGEESKVETIEEESVVETTTYCDMEHTESGLITDDSSIVIADPVEETAEPVEETDGMSDESDEDVTTDDEDTTNQKSNNNNYHHNNKKKKRH